MTKRNTESNIDELREEMLDDLDDRDRFALLMVAEEEGRDQWRERLVESAPVSDYRGPDPEFRRRIEGLLAMADRTVYELHTACLEFYLFQSERATDHLRELYTTPTDEDPDLPSFSDGEESPAEVLADLNLELQARQRFAEQMIGIDLETWVAGHPTGPDVVAKAEATIESNRESLEAVHADLPDVSSERIDLSKEGMPDELPEASSDRVVLLRYAELRNAFRDLLEANSLQSW